MGYIEFTFVDLLCDFSLLSGISFCYFTVPQPIMLNFMNIIQVLEIGSVGKGISQGDTLFYAHAARVIIL